METVIVKGSNNKRNSKNFRISSTKAGPKGHNVNTKSNSARFSARTLEVKIEDEKTGTDRSADRQNRRRSVKKRRSNCARDGGILF